MKLKQITVILLVSGSFFSSAVLAESAMLLKPHFNLEMKNITNKVVTVSFVPGEGNIFLTPSLANQTTLFPFQTSQTYGVNIEPLSSTANFNIVFKSSEDCNFNIGFLSPGKPKVTISGPGCSGKDGYSIIRKTNTLLIYVYQLDSNVTT